ncbi:snoRNA-binding rRNA-processing protein [Phlyctochytrium bullatum]|nr:snoRNA-binding rRNA-processing protein [Phlyctochytrium bullatum]
MSTFKKLSIESTYAPVERRKTSEAKYWGSLKSPILVKEFASVTSIHFSPAAPHDFAVTSSTRVQIYNQATHAVKKTLSRFKDVAYGGTFRNDGKLLIAGDAAGTVQDHVRSAIVSEDNPHLVLSGSYDHAIKLWDMRANSCVMSMEHGHPVESVLFLPGSSMIATAGSNQLKIWNVLSGGSLFQTLCNHQKTITVLCMDGSKTRLVTGSLDQHVKIYNTLDYKVAYSLKYPSPILSLGLSATNSHIAVGMTTGLLSIRHRVLKSKEIFDSARGSEELRGGTYKYFKRGKSHQATETDIKVEGRRRRRLKAYDRFLKSFEYGKALDAVLGTKQSPIVVVSLLDELYFRGGLQIALGGRDDIALEPIARFLVKYLPNPRYSRTLIMVANIVLDMYASVIGQSTIIDELFAKLKRKIYLELEVQEKIMECIGQLETIFASSQRSFA